MEESQQIRRDREREREKKKARGGRQVNDTLLIQMVTHLM